VVPTNYQVTIGSVLAALVVVAALVLLLTNRIPTELGLMVAALGVARLT
jgi:hypothetical protein